MSNLKDKLPLPYQSIPEEWGIDYISNIAVIATGDSDTQDKIDTGEFPFYVRSQTVERADKFTFDGGAILTAGDGAGVGKIFHLVSGKFALHQRVYRISNFAKHIAPEFLFAYFSENFVRQVCKYTAKTSVDSVRMDMIANMAVPIPPLSEQRKIVNTLSIWDKAINISEKLVVTSKQQRKSLIQQLLTGAVRFKDEEGNIYPKWVFEPIGKYLEPYKELVPAETSIPILTSSRTGLYIQERSVINEGDYGVVPLGYFTYRHMSDDLTFKFNVNRTWDKGAVSKEYPVFKTVGLDSYFLETQLNEGNDFKRFAIQQKQGGTRTRLYFKNLKELKLNLPCLREQQKISSMLIVADKEIEMLETKLAHLKQEKKALMQQLLTGKRRMKVDEVEAA
ncbi:restriction endonuclease subunit S [Vibrio splendidus]|uniref:restriction endonuclease subunit S n=1 Tax=Vibrio splendidus TaxID=29497 RepID=UPI00148BAEA2|nr:restriction endonuclease subunit S [Vibrio splendidus]NOJ08295.1 hypothetical protein [Vibrio splendidus]